MHRMHVGSEMAQRRRPNGKNRQEAASDQESREEPPGRPEEHNTECWLAPK